MFTFSNAAVLSSSFLSLFRHLFFSVGVSSFIFIPLSPFYHILLCHCLLVFCFLLFSPFYTFILFFSLNLFLMSSLYRPFLLLSRFLFPPIPIFFSSYCLILLYRLSRSLLTIFFFLLYVYFLYFSLVLPSPAVLLFPGKNSTSRRDVSQLP